MAERGRGVDRRWVVSGLLGAAVLPASACGIRLEDDAPRVPLVPTRTPVPVEAALVALTRDTVALATASAALEGDLAADLAALHRRQHTVLRTTLLRRQVPAADLDAPAASPVGVAPRHALCLVVPLAVPDGRRTRCPGGPRGGRRGRGRHLR